VVRVFRPTGSNNGTNWAGDLGAAAIPGAIAGTGITNVGSNTGTGAADSGIGTATGTSIEASLGSSK
jgi:hypothetical protein